MIAKAAGFTDVGLKRDENEDSFSTEESLALYIVADGMGGHLAGEVASRIAVDMVNKSFQKWMEEDAAIDELFGPPDDSLSLRGNYISGSLRLANRVIYELAMEYEQYHGMGTTVCLLHLTPEITIAANVGDSRIYMVRDASIEMLSRDHTLVSEQVQMGIMTPEEAETSSLKHVLTRSLGSTETVEPDIFEIESNDNDRFILCSDGLTDVVSDQEILEMTQKADDPQKLSRQFIEKALKRGGPDNTTVVAVFVNHQERAHKKGAGILGLFRGV